MINATKAAQIFSVDGEFVPTKTSTYLLTNLFLNNKYFDATSQVVIDASNFSTLTSDTQRIFYTDVETGYSGPGYLIYPSTVYSPVNVLNAAVNYMIIENPNNFNIIGYPIKNVGNNDIYVRLKDVDGIGDCNIEVYIDSVFESRSNIVFTGADWEWHKLNSISLSESNIYELGIRLYTDGIAFDQMVINPTVAPSGAVALALTDSPFITAHMGVYNVNNSFKPTTPLYIHDFKTSIDELKQDGWYNFDLNFIDSSLTDDFLKSYALYFSVSGSNSKNFITWERVDADVYSFEPSAYNE